MTPADLPEEMRDLAESVVRHLQALAEEATATDTARPSSNLPAADDDEATRPRSVLTGTVEVTDPSPASTAALPPVHLEWSQAGTQHSGRLTIGDRDDARQLPVPEPITTDMAGLRAMMARPGTGTWLSATVHLTGGQATLGFNYDQRPYWNATAASMLQRPEAAPVPDDARWAADLRRYPRDQDHLLNWLAVQVVAGGEVQRLRQALDQAGHPAGGVALPGEQQVPFEGCVAMVRHSTAHYSMQVLDYGQHEFLAEYSTEELACRAVWDYLNQPLPAPTPVSQTDLHQRAQAAEAAYADLHRRLNRAGPGGIITNLAAGVPFDRIGTLDGLYFFAWHTPWQQRSLPDSARGPGAQQVVLMAPAPVEVHATLVPPWFGQPGGGIRFRIEGAKHQGLRDLVRTGTLLRIQPGL